MKKMVKKPIKKLQKSFIIRISPEEMKAYKKKVGDVVEIDFNVTNSKDLINEKEGTINGRESKDD